MSNEIDLAWVDGVPQEVEDALPPKIRRVLRALKKLRAEQAEG